MLNAADYLCHIYHVCVQRKRSVDAEAQQRRTPRESYNVNTFEGSDFSRRTF